MYKKLLRRGESVPNSRFEEETLERLKENVTDIFKKETEKLRPIDVILNSPVIPDSVGELIDSVVDLVEDSEIAKKIIETLGDLWDKLIENYQQEAKAARTLQDASKAFAMPYKNDDYIKRIKLMQLAATPTPGFDGNTGDGTGSSGGYNGKYSGTTEEIVWQYFTNNGYSKESTAGIMGNIQHESGFKTDALESGGDGFGLIQWSNVRRDAIEAKAAADNADINDVNFQLEYLQWELESGDYWAPSSGSANYDFEKFKTGSDIVYSTEAFCWMFEKPLASVARMDRRIQAAKDFYEEFKDADFSSGTYTGDATGLARAIVEECKKYDGLGYTQNTNPNNGPVRTGPTHYDCSGLTQRIYQDVVGIDIGTSTHTQCKYSGGKVMDASQRKAGDLLFYGQIGSTVHVSISLGGNEIFHAATPEMGILYGTISAHTMQPDFLLRINELM